VKKRGNAAEGTAWKNGKKGVSPARRCRGKKEMVIVNGPAWKA